jgi:hypothetical protein
LAELDRQRQGALGRTSCIGDCVSNHGRAYRSGVVVQKAWLSLSHDVRRIQIV